MFEQYVTVEKEKTIYQRVTEELQDSNAVYLLGPKYCGKTTCLKQIEKEVPEVKYIDFSALSEKESEALQAQVLRSIEEYEPILYLLDHIAYVDKWFLYAMYNALSMSKVRVGNHTDIFKKGTHVVMSSSISAIMRHWYVFGFGGCHCAIIYVDFPYDDRIKNSWLPPIDKYFKEYLEETHMAMTRTGYVPKEIVPECDLVNEFVLMDILSGDSKRLQKWDEEVLRQGLSFLFHSNMIAFTQLRQEEECRRSLETELKWNNGWYNFREDYNKKYTYSVIHPWLKAH